MTETCTRCGKTVDDDAREIIDWEWFGDDGSEPACGDCVTSSEIHAIADDEVDFVNAMKSAGLDGDVEQMEDDEPVAKVIPLQRPS